MQLYKTTTRITTTKVANTQDVYNKGNASDVTFAGRDSHS